MVDSPSVPMRNRAIGHRTKANLGKRGHWKASNRGEEIGRHILRLKRENPRFWQALRRERLWLRARLSRYQYPSVIEGKADG